MKGACSQPPKMSGWPGSFLHLKRLLQKLPTFAKDEITQHENYWKCVIFNVLTFFQWWQAVDSNSPQSGKIFSTIKPTMSSCSNSPRKKDINSTADYPIKWKQLLQPFKFQQLVRRTRWFTGIGINRGIHAHGKEPCAYLLVF